MIQRYCTDDVGTNVHSQEECMVASITELAHCSASERAAYERDGAIVVRAALDRRWIERMRTAIARLIDTHPGVTLWMARVDPEFAAFAADAGLAQLAGELMSADRVNFFYDQMFVKQPRSSNPTPLHQDLPYWPVEGEQIISIWVPFDRVTRDNSVVQYVKGSHRWGRMFEPVSFSQENVPRDKRVGSAGYERIVDPDVVVKENEILSWELDPGDVLVHHPLTLHFATPNLTANENRRAIALRYVGPNSRFIDRPGNFMRTSNPSPFWPTGPIISGAAVDGPDYPLVWRRAEERS
jgi:ectoine hydroxylase-related dioxygenase (phytanoyl-CoA dioxygenase family)